MAATSAAYKYLRVCVISKVGEGHRVCVIGSSYRKNKNYEVKT